MIHGIEIPTSSGGTFAPARERTRIYLAPELENLVTDLVPSEIACFANSPGRMRRTAVWISREEIVDFLEYEASSGRTRVSNVSLEVGVASAYWMLQ